MDAEGNKNKVLAIGLIVSFALLVISVSLFYDLLHEERAASRLMPDAIDQMTKEEIKSKLEAQYASMPTLRPYYFLPFFAFIGLFVGTVVYYIMADRIVHQETVLQKNTRIILKFLNPLERKVVDTILENGGKVQQYELSHLPNLNKVKTHRILKNLENKGIIAKERLGKVNRVVLNQELYEVLRES
ncbi:MAG: hypothetical protein QGG50_02010 [Methanopyri archaeon]|nr:hypothetical protein [Methanopyri archaeon]